jgi:hypothetical protein
MLALLCLNPLLYGAEFPLSLSPDAISYLSLADSITSGRLFLSGWGHIDSNVILPPLYPSLIAVLNIFHPDAVSNAVAISFTSMVLLGLVAYLFVRQFTVPLLAAAAALLIQLNFYFVHLATSAFTEALFLLILAATLLFAVHVTSERQPNKWHALTLGLLAALIFLTRQIGLVVGAYLLIWFSIDAALYRKGGQRQKWQVPAFFVAGFAILMVPYATTLFVQTGASIFQQQYRAQSYVVTTDDPVLTAKIEKLESGENYLALYINRRALRELTPDSSEMLANLVRTSPKDGTPSAPPEEIDTGVLHNLASNLTHFSQHLGKVLLGLLMAACVTPLFFRPVRTPWWPRLLLPGFIVAYIVGISLLTGLIERYIVILFAFAIAQIAVELGMLFRWWNQRFNPHISEIAIPTLFVISLSLALLTVSRIERAAEAPQDGKLSVIPAEPAFALLPAYSYLAGGSFRIMPNDKLEKAVQYARRTGVRWLLVPKEPEISKSEYYTKAEWLQTPHALMKRTDILRYCCTISVVQEHLLFEIQPAASETDR